VKSAFKSGAFDFVAQQWLFRNRRIFVFIEQEQK
jgi:hypothetical protein